MQEKDSVPAIRFSGFMDNWEHRKLGDYCDMYNGDRSDKYPNAQDMVSDGIPFINAGDLENGRVNLATANKITQEKYDDLGGARLQMGDIVYCLRGTLGKNAYIDNFKEGTVASSLVVIRPKNINGRYFFHILNSDIEYRQRVVHDEGAAQPNLSAKSVSEFTMPVPDIEEQNKVASYFDTLDHLITLHQHKYSRLCNIKKSMLKRMFPREGATVPEIRFAGFTDDWEQRKLGDIATFINGRAYSQSELLKEGKYKVLRVGNFYTNDSWYYSDLELSDKYYADYGDLLYTWSATFGPHIWLGNKVIYHYHIWKVELSNQLEKHFTVQLLEQDKANILSRKNGSTMVHITKEGMEQKEVIIPPNIAEQRAIGAYFEKLDHLITLHQRELGRLQNIKKACLEKMFV